MGAKECEGRNVAQGEGWRSEQFRGKNRGLWGQKNKLLDGGCRLKELNSFAGIDVVWEHIFVAKVLKVFYEFVACRAGTSTI